MFIGIGNCSFLYLYIIGLAVFDLIEDYLLSLDDIKEEYIYNIFHIILVLKSHKLIRILYRYISFIIFGLIFFYISQYKKNTSSNKGESENSDNLSKTSHRKLIVKKYTQTRKIFFELLFVCGLYTLLKVIRKIVSFYKVSDLDFWIFNIVFISIYMHRYFGNKLYKHQKYSLCFIFFTNIILLFISASIKKNEKYETSFQKHKWKCIFILLAYIIFSWISSFSKVASKKLMDINYISPYRIIFFMGLFGTFFALISLIVTSSINCGEKSDYCKVKKTKNITTFNETLKAYINETEISTYLDNLPLYFSELKNVYKNRNYKEFYVEIFVVTPLFIFFNFLEFTCEMQIILNLNPNYKLISDCLYFGTTKLLEFTIKGGYSTSKFTLEYIAELLALVGYIIFLEIIELKFCGLDEDLKKNIMERSIRDTAQKEMDININDDNISDDEDDDIEETKKKPINSKVTTTSSS